MGIQNNSIELTEKSLLGTMLQENYLIADSNWMLLIFHHRCINIFSRMFQLVSERKVVDYITLLTNTRADRAGRGKLFSRAWQLRQWNKLKRIFAGY